MIKMSVYMQVEELPQKSFENQQSTSQREEIEVNMSIPLKRTW